MNLFKFALATTISTTHYAPKPLFMDFDYGGITVRTEMVSFNKTLNETDSGWTEGNNWTEKIDLQELLDYIRGILSRSGKVRVQKYSQDKEMVITGDRINRITAHDDALYDRTEWISVLLEEINFQQFCLLQTGFQPNYNFSLVKDSFGNLNINVESRRAHSILVVKYNGWYGWFRSWVAWLFSCYCKVEYYSFNEED